MIKRRNNIPGRGNSYYKGLKLRNRHAVFEDKSRKRGGDVNLVNTEREAWSESPRIYKPESGEHKRKPLEVCR